MQRYCAYASPARCNDIRSIFKVRETGPVGIVVMAIVQLRAHFDVTVGNIVSCAIAHRISISPMPRFQQHVRGLPPNQEDGSLKY